MGCELCWPGLRMCGWACVHGRGLPRALSPDCAHLPLLNGGLVGAAEVTGQKVTDITKLVEVIEGEPAEAMDLS
jgi:hypothetical protein